MENVMDTGYIWGFMKGPCNLGFMGVPINMTATCPQLPSIKSYGIRSGASTLSILKLHYLNSKLSALNQLTRPLCRIRRIGELRYAITSNDTEDVGDYRPTSAKLWTSKYMMTPSPSSNLLICLPVWCTFLVTDLQSPWLEGDAFLENRKDTFCSNSRILWWVQGHSLLYMLHTRATYIIKLQVRLYETISTVKLTP